MRYTLIFAVAIAVLGCASATPTRSEKEMVCGFLEEVELDRNQMLESLSRKAYSLGKSAIRMLPENSGFKTCINNDLEFSLLTQTPDGTIRFLRKFKCAYKRQILCNRSYQSQPEFRQMYDNWKSESKDIVRNTESKTSGKVQNIVNKLWRTSDNTQDLQRMFLDPYNAYLKRNSINTHEMFNNFLNTAKSNFECTYELAYL